MVARRNSVGIKPSDGPKWERAKKAVSKARGKRESQFSPRDWGLVMHIFKGMGQTSVQSHRTKAYFVVPVGTRFSMAAIERDAAAVVGTIKELTALVQGPAFRDKSWDVYKGYVDAAGSLLEAPERWGSVSP